MIVHHFSAATLCPLSARLVNGAGGLFELGSVVCHCWLIESNDGLVLVETGIGREDLTDVARRLGRWFKWVVRPDTAVENTAWAQVQKLGFDIREVRHIIPTHLDLDHSGGLADFPDAQVHIFRPEYEAAQLRAGLRDRERYHPAHWAHQPRWDVREPIGETWFGFEGVRAIDRCEELLLIPLPGHTRGHCGVAVRTSRGWLLHAGDAYFFHGQLTGEARCPPGLAAFDRITVTDNAARLKNRRRLVELRANHGSEVSIHCAHCPIELERFAPSAGGPGVQA